jgi:hypothetical protein
MVLLPKKPEAIEPADFRPISLVHMWARSASLPLPASVSECAEQPWTRELRGSEIVEWS